MRIQNSGLAQFFCYSQTLHSKLPEKRAGTVSLQHLYKTKIHTNLKHLHTTLIQKSKTIDNTKAVFISFSLTIRVITLQFKLYRSIFFYWFHSLYQQRQTRTQQFHSYDHPGFGCRASASFDICNAFFLLFFYYTL